MELVNPNIDPALFNYAINNLQRYFPVNEEQAVFMLNCSEIRNFSKRTVVLNVGEIEGYLSMVVSGLVRKYVRRGKNESTLQLATEGHIIHSEISFLKQNHSLVAIETIEPTTMIGISYKSLNHMLDHMPGGDRMGRQLLVAMFAKKDERHYKSLSLSTRERFLDYLKNHPHMLQRVPQKHLASYLNIKPETFSRLKHLVKLS